MKISKKQLRRIIKEEKAKVLKEQYGMSEELSPLVQFGRAWAGLGGAVGEQMNTVVNAFIENREEDVYDINPNALDLGFERLMPALRQLGPNSEEADTVIEALEWARRMFEQGEEELAADIAAGDAAAGL